LSPDPRRPRLPDFVLNPHQGRGETAALKARLRRARLHTVCESARCPNLVECFRRPTAAFLILGNRCTRGCGFCAVEAGAPLPPSADEPAAVAEAAEELGLEHVVVTSVTRDDLDDGGAAQFAAVIRAVHGRLPGARVEALVPDFGGSESALATVMAARPDVLNHNLETVPRLYARVRPGADYRRSLELLARAAATGGGRALVKSGLMVGLGEEKDEVIASFCDLVAAGCGLVTVGQYLQPRRDRLPVARYWAPEEYGELERAARELGLRIFAGPLVRSSYLADRAFRGGGGAGPGD